MTAMWALTSRRYWRSVRVSLVPASLALALIAAGSLIGVSRAGASTPTTVSSWTALSSEVSGCSGSLTSLTSLTVTLGATITIADGSNLMVQSGCNLTLNLAGYDLSITNVAAGTGEAAIAVPAGASLDIEDVNSSGTVLTTGTLTATGGGAGIGGGGGGFGAADGKSGALINAGTLELGSALTVSASGSLANTGTISSLSGGTGVSLVNNGVVLTNSASAISVTESGTSPVVFAPQMTGTPGGSQTLSGTGVVTGETLSFALDASSGAGVCTVSGSTLSYTRVGTCVVDATLSNSSTPPRLWWSRRSSSGGPARVCSRKHP